MVAIVVANIKIFLVQILLRDATRHGGLGDSLGNSPMNRGARGLGRPSWLERVWPA